MRTLVGGSGDEELKPGMVMGIEPLICETESRFCDAE